MGARDGKVAIMTGASGGIAHPCSVHLDIDELDLLMALLVRDAAATL